MQIIPPKAPNHLRLVHTADWHLGKRLMHENRYTEFEEFLYWLTNCLIETQADVLIVAGDVFDTMTPSNKAQELYYQFLSRLTQTPCRHTIIIAGNHDSPSFLDAPKALCRHLNIHIIGTISDDPNDNVLILHNNDGMPALIVGAVPYLRERDVRQGQFGDTLDQKRHDIATGIQHHYTKIVHLCQQKQSLILEEYGIKPPIVSTGHLFATGASIASGDDGMRDLYVGNLGQIGADIFQGFDYVALGHIHREQMVGKQPHIRYAGSPLALGFGECKQDKKILIVDLSHNTTPIITPLSVPIFRPLQVLVGDFDTLSSQLHALIKQPPTHHPFATPKPCWLALEYHTDSPVYDWQNKLSTIIDGHPFVILSQKLIKITQPKSPPTQEYHTLHSLTPQQVFQSVLDRHADITEHTPLMALYNTLVYELYHDDKHAT